MTTYYGVWSGGEWWFYGNEPFHTTVRGLAVAQARAVNAMRECKGWGKIWQARAIGEDGLPVEKEKQCSS